MNIKSFIKLISFISYWIFLWYLLFIFKIVKANPLLFLIISFIFILIQIYYLYVNKSSKYNLIKYIIINLFIKIIPIFILIIYYPISFNYNDISFGLFIILIYGITMIILNINPINSYNKIINNYIKNNNENDKTEVSKLYDYIYNIIKEVKK
jgi:hypothetical protein